MAQVGYARPVNRKTGALLLLPVAVIAIGAIFWVLQGTPDDTRGSDEVDVRPIQLRGGAEASSAELSGLAWWRDTLVLLPQYPERFDNSVFTLSRDAIEAFVDGDMSGSLEVGRVPFVTPEIDSDMYDGFEAIVFDHDRVYVSIETRRSDSGVVGLVLRGRVEGDLERIVIDAMPRAELEAQNELENTGYEALIVHGDQLIAVYETNGEVNDDPHVLVFDSDLAPMGTMPFIGLEYRVTDASAVDRDGHFWVANYHWPLTPWASGQCELTERYGQGESHARCQTVERLVELEVTSDGIAPTDRAPLQIRLIDDAHARNWEGLVRLGSRGFLVVTDEHPETIFAFLPLD